jgi:hypothetical protein
MLPALVYATSCVDSNPNISSMGVLPPCYLASVSYPQANVQTSQTYYFNATTNGSWLVGFTFRQDPGFWTFKNPSLTAVIPYNPTEILQNANLSQGGNIIVNGASISAPLNFQVWFQAGQPPPAAGTWSPGQWYDGAVGTFDGIYQGVNVNQDTQYKLSFNLTGTNPSDGKGIQLGVYALPCANTAVSITSCVPPTNLGFGVAVPDSVSPTPSISVSVSNSNSISSSVSSQRTSSVSVSSFASVSVSPTGTPSVSIASTPSITSAVSPSQSNSNSMTPSITSSSTITRSKSNSKSLTMSDSTCSTPSPINLLLSATSSPLFLITAFPTPSLTPAASMNVTLGGASGGVELGTIMGGVSVGLVGVLGAILAFLHIPRPAFLQNFLKNPVGNITKLVSDIKDPSKMIKDLQEMTQNEEQPTTVSVDANVVVAEPLPVLSQAQKVIAQSFRTLSPQPQKVVPVPVSPPPQPKTPITPPVRSNPVQPSAPQKPKQNENKNQKAKIELDLKDLPAIQAYLNSKKTDHKIVK